MDNLEQRGTRVLAFKREYVGQHLVQHDARRKDVGSRIHVSTVDLLGGHVLDTSDELAGAGDVLCPDPSNSEVDQLDGAILQQHYVPRLDVSVNDALLMRICESITDLDHDAQLFFQEQRPIGAEGYIQALAFEKLHDEIGHSLLDPKIIDGHDVGVSKLAHGLRFPIEALQERWIIDDRAGHHLDANQSSDRRIHCLVHDSHTASTDDFEDFLL